MDRFRKNYNPLSDEQKALVSQIKNKATELEQLYDSLLVLAETTLFKNVNDLNSDEFSTRYHEVGANWKAAMDALEVSVMWGGKAAMANLQKIEWTPSTI